MPVRLRQGAVALLFDTHAWVWSVEDDRRLGRRARRLVSSADARDLLRVSSASVFEVAALHTAGRLRVSTPIEPWIREALDAGGVGLAEVTRNVAMDAGSISRTALTDPVDRLLVATARQLGATFLSADRAVLDYAAATGQLRVHDASV